MNRLILRFSLLGLALGAACGGNGVTDGPSTPPSRDTTSVTPPGGGIQRSVLTARVTVDPADAPVGSAANLSLSGLSVRLLREGTPASSAVATTDPNGVARFENLLEGRYSVTVERVLTEAEQTRLPATDRDATMFAGGVSVDIAPPQPADAHVALVASRRGSLVMSEQYGYTGVPIPYNWGMYLEFYNNADTTVYMDGMLLVRPSARLEGGFAPCTDPVYARYRSDTSAIWVETGIRFPGTGRDFPVRPGETRVFAQDAANHRTASGSGSFLDLSRADFEHVGNDSDSDNPLASNVIGLFATGFGSGGRGLRPFGHAPWVLARTGADARGDSVRLRRVSPPPSGSSTITEFSMWSIRREDVLDVMSLDGSPEYIAYLSRNGYTPPCEPYMAHVFDRAPAPVSDYRVPVAARRRAIGRTADGRLILMRTRTSARDIESTTRLRERFQ